MITFACFSSLATIFSGCFLGIFVRSSQLSRIVLSDDAEEKMKKQVDLYKYLLIISNLLASMLAAAAQLSSWPGINMWPIIVAAIAIVLGIIIDLKKATWFTFSIILLVAISLTITFSYWLPLVIIPSFIVIGFLSYMST